MAEYWVGSLTVPPLQMTLPIGILALLAVLYSLRRRSKADFFLLVWVALVFLWFVPIHKDLRYTMPYLPALAILSGRLLKDLSGKAVEEISGRTERIGGVCPSSTILVLCVLVLLIVSPVLYGLVARPRELRVPIQEAFVYVADNVKAGRNVLILLSCNNFSQYASYFYMYMTAGLDASIHVLNYPSDSVDWYDPGPINMTRISRICAENDVQYVLLWDGSPYAGSWLPTLLDSDLLNLQATIGSKGNAIYVLEFQSSTGNLTKSLEEKH
jgi:hypothetical protein